MTVRPSTAADERERRQTRHTIPGGHGFAFEIKKGARMRIIDLHGAQIIDFMAWKAPYSPSTTCEHFSASYTRHALGSAAPPAIGEHLYTNKDRKMFEIVADTVKVHDMQFMACNPGFYERLGKRKHRSCANNVAEAMTEFLRGKGDARGIIDADAGNEVTFEWWQVHDPFNVFQNTPYYAIKPRISPSRKGDYLDLRAQMDCVVALSSCPYHEDGYKDGGPTEVAVTWEAEE